MENRVAHPISQVWCGVVARAAGLPSEVSSGLMCCCHSSSVLRCLVCSCRELVVGLYHSIGKCKDRSDENANIQMVPTFLTEQNVEQKVAGCWESCACLCNSCVCACVLWSAIFPWGATAPAGAVEVLFAAGAGAACMNLAVSTAPSDVVHSSAAGCSKSSESVRCFLPQLVCVLVCVLYLCCRGFGPRATQRFAKVCFSQHLFCCSPACRPDTVPVPVTVRLCQL